MKENKIVEELIEYAANGNDIRKNDTYMKMLKRISTNDITNIIRKNNYNWDLEDIGRSQKIDFINSIVKHNF